MNDTEYIIIFTVGGVAGALILVAIIVALYCYCSSRSKYQKLLDEEKGKGKGGKRKSKVKSEERAPLTRDSSSSTVAKPRHLDSEDSLMAARMYVRGSDFANPKPLESIGHNSSKFYFMVEQKSGKSKSLMCLSNVSGDLFSSDSNRNSFKKMMMSINHPYLLPTEAIEHHKDRNVLVTFRPFTKGSLRDYIHSAKPADPYFKKYSTTSGRPLNEKKIAKYGRQILEAIEYLRVNQFPFINIHTANIILDNGVCRLTDYESQFLQFDPKFKLVLQYNMKKNVDPVVTAFGCVLYEMSVGYEMDSTTLDDIPSTCNPKSKKILKSIFEPSAEDIPTIQSLLKQPFFAEVKLYSDWVPEPIKMDNKAKQMIQTVSSLVHEALSAPMKAKKSSKKAESSSTESKTPDKVPKSTNKKSKPKKKSSKSKKKEGGYTSGSATESATSDRDRDAVTNAPAPPPPPPGTASAPSSSSSSSTTEHKKLLNSIESFNIKKLKKTETNDRSAPLL